MHFEYSDSAHSPAMCRCHFGQDHTAAERANGNLPFVDDDLEPLGSARPRARSRWFRLRRATGEVAARRAS